MCGISGLISKNVLSSSLIKKMNDRIIHRGPDDEGFLFGGVIDYDIDIEKSVSIDFPFSIGLGHRRLSIVDLSSLGHQPMSYNERYWIVFNGEIYNHIEIRNELEMEGYQFASKTDTEVILASYDFWGKDCLNKFNGMWSFVLIDTTKNEIFISRDRFGIKPLYYYQDSENFIFASEIKAIIENPDVAISKNLKFCETYIEYGCSEHSKDTAFNGIQKFDFGCFHLSSISDIFKPLNEVKFWQLTPNTSNEDFNLDKLNYYANRYYELLNDAVRLRLRADVRVGSASSGGLDSSSIVYLVNKQLSEECKQEKQETFSTVYKSPGSESCDESIYIDEITRTLNVVSNQIEPNFQDVPIEHDRLIYHLENPPESTLMSSWYTFKLVGASNITVTLDGQGADEQLAGYKSYIRYYWASKKLNLGIFKDLMKFYETNNINYALFGLFMNLLSKLFGKKLTIKMCFLFTRKNYNVFENLNERLNNDLSSHLVTLLHYSDHTSMAHSIESRMPFMDYRLVEFLSSVPACYKIHDGWTKYIARIAFKDKLPDSIVWRKDKMGWSIPEDYWFRGSLNKWFESLVRNGIDLMGHNQPRNLLSINKSKAIRYLNLFVCHRNFFSKQ